MIYVFRRGCDPGITIDEYSKGKTFIRTKNYFVMYDDDSTAQFNVDQIKFKLLGAAFCTNYNSAYGRGSSWPFVMEVEHRGITLEREDERTCMGWPDPIR